MILYKDIPYFYIFIRRFAMSDEYVSSHPISEIDLSGYQYDIVPTYKMIEDIDDQDSLFRIQFLQAFGITTDEYHPDIVSAVINDLYDRYGEKSGIREILEAHPLFNAGKTTTIIEEADENLDTTSPPLSPSAHQDGGDNSEMIFCMMFSFQTFDLFHMCLRHAKHGEEIPPTLRDEIVECLKTMF